MYERSRSGAEADWGHARHMFIDGREACDIDRRRLSGWTSPHPFWFIRRMDLSVTDTVPVLLWERQGRGMCRSQAKRDRDGDV